MTQRTINRAFILALVAGGAYLFFRLLAPFLLPIFLAAVLCSLFYPLYEGLARRLKGKRGLASFLTCLILLVGLVVPVYVVADLVVKEAISFYHTAETKVREIVAQGEAGPLGKLHRLPLVRTLELDRIDWRANLQGTVATLGGALTGAVKVASSGTIKLIVTLFITLFTMFYFFLDGKALVQRIKDLVPLDSRHEDAIVARFAAVSRATIRGTLLIAAVQGSLAGLTLWIFGVGSPILWGVVATLLAIIPMAGAGMVLIPAALIQILTGDVWQGIGIAVVTLVVINNVDNVLRVRLVGQETGLHDLLVFFSTLGGIELFGPIGFIAGPMIAALFLSLIDIYGRELGRGALAPSPSPPASMPEISRAGDDGGGSGADSDAGGGDSAGDGGESRRVPGEPTRAGSAEAAVPEAAEAAAGTEGEAERVAGRPKPA